VCGRETRRLLRHYLEQGTRKSALARQLGVSRDTIHRWIRAGDLDRDLDSAPVRYGAPPPCRYATSSSGVSIRTVAVKSVIVPSAGTRGPGPGLDRPAAALLRLPHRVCNRS